jgi:outer membrane protein assembly factor BamB
VYIGSHDGNVYALDASSGDKLWNYTIGDSITSSPAVNDGTVYIGGENAVYALTVTNGTKLWSYSTGNYVGSSPAIVNGVLYVAGGNNTYAFGGSSPSASPNIQLLVIPIIVVILIVALIAVIIFKKKIASGVNRNGFV